MAHNRLEVHTEADSIAGFWGSLQTGDPDRQLVFATVRAFILKLLHCGGSIRSIRAHAIYFIYATRVPVGFQEGSRKV